MVLVIVKLKVVDPPTGIVAAPKDLLIVGGVATATATSASESGQAAPVEMVHLSTTGPAPPVWVKVELPA